MLSHYNLIKQVRILTDYIPNSHKVIWTISAIENPTLISFIDLFIAILPNSYSISVIFIYFIQIFD